MAEHPYRLMAPGPVSIPKSAMDALSQPMLHHRTPKFVQKLEKVFVQLKEAFQTKQPVFLLTSTGSGAMEAAVVNTLSPGDKAVCIRSGKFGERWGKMAAAYDVDIKYIDVPWGESVSTQTVADFLEQNPETKVVFCQACETSTGALHPVKDLAQLIRNKENTIFAVDAITAIGCIDLPMDEFGIDVLVAGSQKAFMIPTGIAFISLSEKAWQFQTESRIPKFYFNLAAEKKAYESGQTLFSSPVSHISALEATLKYFTDKERPNTQKRIEALSKATTKTVEFWGWSIFPKNPCPSLTVIRVPDGVNGKKWRQNMEDQHNITIMGGQDDLTGKILRIGHMGAISDEDLLETLRALVITYNELASKPISEASLLEGLNLCEAFLKESP